MKKWCRSALAIPIEIQLRFSCDIFFNRPPPPLTAFFPPFLLNLDLFFFLTKPTVLSPIRNDLGLCFGSRFTSSFFLISTPRSHTTVISLFFFDFSATLSSSVPFPKGPSDRAPFFSLYRLFLPTFLPQPSVSIECFREQHDQEDLPPPSCRQADISMSPHPL